MKQRLFQFVVTQCTLTGRKRPLFSPLSYFLKPLLLRGFFWPIKNIFIAHPITKGEL